MADYDEALKACPLCESVQIRRYDHDELGNVIFRCRQCRLKFMNPQYTDRHLGAYYSMTTHTPPPPGGGICGCPSWTAQDMARDFQVG